MIPSRDAFYTSSSVSVPISYGNLEVRKNLASPFSIIQRILKWWIILKRMKFIKLQILFVTGACQLSLSQVQVVLHFSWQKYTLTLQPPHAQQHAFQFVPWHRATAWHSSPVFLHQQTLLARSLLNWEAKQNGETKQMEAAPTIIANLHMSDCSTMPVQLPRAHLHLPILLIR